MEIFKRKLNNQQTQKNNKSVAWFYNSWSKLTESKAAEIVIKLAEIKDGERIVEIACRTGLVFKEILNRNPNGKNLGIDLSMDMLSKAKILLKKESNQNYELRQGDVLNMEIENQSYDTLINNFMIDLMPEEKFDDILLEFHRILKPNGVAIISIFSQGNKKVNKFWVWIAKHFPKLLTDCRPVEIKDNLNKIGFVVEQEVEISQNTFPSKIYKLRKTMANHV